MAISKNIVSLNPGFGSTDVIYQLEQQFTYLNLHGTGRSGLIVGVSSYTDPGRTSSVRNERFSDIRQKSTTGIGTGASFYVYRQGNGDVNELRPNRPGYGYTAGDTITLSAEDLGGSANGANDVIIKPAIYAHKTSDAQTFDVELTGLYEISGTDRNGTISDKTITVKEGDSIRFTDNLGSQYYGFGVYWDRGPYNSTFQAADGNGRYYGSEYNRVFNTYYASSNGGGGEIITWTPECGQRGIFRVLDNSNYSSVPITIIVEPDDSNWAYPTVGSATTFHGRFSDPNAIYAWGVLKHDIEPDKKFGSTYRAFQVVSDNNMVINVGSDFYPNIGISTISRGTDSFTSAYRRNRFCGAYMSDMPYNLTSIPGMLNDNSYENDYSNPTKIYTNYCQIKASEFKYTESNAYRLDLTSYKSGLNPKFVVYSYRQPTRSSTNLGGNTYATFILHDHIGTIWDHDNCFTSGVTKINFGGGSPDNPYISFTTHIAGDHYDRYNAQASQRAGEYGYLNSDFGNYSDYYDQATTIYHPNSYKMGGDVSTSDSRIYYRGLEDRRDRDGITADMDFNAVIKGIPICTQLVPFPFYIPDDFVLIQFDYATPNSNIQQGDTVTVSGSEIYEVIVGSYNQTDRTRGILFCARTT